MIMGKRFVTHFIVLSKLYSVYLITTFANKSYLQIVTFDNDKEPGNTGGFAPKLLML